MRLFYTAVMDTSALEERLERLETKMAWLEDFTTQLHEEVLKRALQTDRMLSEQAALKERLLLLVSELEEVPNRRPPHY